MKSIYTSLKTIIFLGFLLFFVKSATGSMIPLSTERLTKNSELVLMGRVQSVYSYWSDDHNTIYSRAMILPSNIIKGNVSSWVVYVEYEGGEVGDVGLQVSDEPTFKEGENVLVFLCPRNNNSIRQEFNVYRLYGSAQGKYVIDRNGIARKGGFSIIKSDEESIDNDIPIKELANKIRGGR